MLDTQISGMPPNMIDSMSDSENTSHRHLFSLHRCYGHLI